MIRLVTIASLLSVLILVLYLPSAYPPERFISHLRAEHELLNEFWEHGAGTRTLARMLDLHAAAKETGAAHSTPRSVRPNSVNSAVANQMSEVNSRLFNNDYFRSIDALFALATYRISVFVEALPSLLVFLAVALFDGFLARIVKSKEFLQHNPEMFALHLCGAIVVGCATIVVTVLPVTVPPVTLCIVPLTLSVFSSRAIANFHRRG